MKHFASVRYGCNALIGLIILSVHHALHCRVTKMVKIEDLGVMMMA